MSRFCLSLLVAVCLAAAGPGRAEVKLQERNKMKFEGAFGAVMGAFGGSAMKDGQTRTVAVRGDRKLSLDDDGGELVDLKEEKVYRLDARKQTYEVLTFADLRKKMKQGTEEAGKHQESQKAEGKHSREEEMEAELDVKRTGQKKAINGFDAEQVIVTVTIHEKGKALEEEGGTVITQDLWLSKDVKASGDVLEFDRRYFEKLYGSGSAPPMGGLAMMAATNPGLGRGMQKLQAEAGKIDGYPILSTMTVEGVKKPEPKAQEEEPPSRPSGLGGFLAKTVAAKVAPRSEPRSTLMTSSNELLSMSRTVSEADVAMPAGYKQR